LKLVVSKTPSPRKAQACVNLNPEQFFWITLAVPNPGILAPLFFMELWEEVQAATVPGAAKAL
jgi:hypothetical protein